MTLNEIVYDIKNSATKAIQNQSIKLSDKQVAEWVHNYRARLIKQDTTRYKQVVTSLIQDLGCVPVKCLDSSECCDIGSGEIILRTVDPIPSPVLTPEYDGITFVGLVDKNTAIQYSSAAQARYAKYKKYTAYQRRAYLREGYIYITNPNEYSRLKLINIQGIFENPEDVVKYDNCGNPDNCDFWNEEYPIDSFNISTIKQLIRDNELRMYLSIPDDNTNNDNTNK